jgi:hypothetical protein
VSTGNGHPPTRAARRRIENNTPAASGLGTAEDTLARVIGETVALRLAELLARLPQPQQTGCSVCCIQAKQAQQAHAIAVENAKKAAEPEPDPPQMPIQAAFTTGPVYVAPEQPPVWLPVCFDHLSAQAGPLVRQTGLVFPDGRPVVAQAG